MATALSRSAQAGRARRVASTRLPTRWGVFQAYGFECDVAEGGSPRVETALALVLGDPAAGHPLVRIHSQCFTGEILGSLRCDCSGQLDLAMRAIAGEARGVLIYEHQEGRGIGLMAKLRAYALQDNGLDTVEANHALGFTADGRDFALPAAILRQLFVRRVRLLTNNPRKSRALAAAGIEVVAQLSCEVEPTSHSLPYLRAKRDRMGHALTLGQRTGASASGAFATVEAALAELKAGRMVVVVDDEGRENEGDLTMAAEMVTPEAINFMATHGKGLVCLALTGDRLHELDLPAMVSDNTALGGTAFTVSIDAKGHGVTTGISAHDRAHTIRTAIDPRCRPQDLARPGHVFPLRARAGGVLERRGHTEAAVDLASLAGFSPAGVICEIVNDDGTMARMPDLAQFCKQHGLVMVTVAELARQRAELDFDGFLAATDGVFADCLRDPQLLN